MPLIPDATTPPSAASLLRADSWLSTKASVPLSIATAPLRSTKKPRSAGLFRCARVDSNHHGEISPQGPQPCASTNSATGAEEASIASGATAALGVGGVFLHPSRGGARVRTHVRCRHQSTLTGSRPAMDLTKRQQ